MLIPLRFLESVSREEEPGILLRLSDETGLTPALLTRTVIERHHQRADQSSKLLQPYYYLKTFSSQSSFLFLIKEPARCLVSSLMKNTALIEDRDLAFESYLVRRTYPHRIFFYFMIVCLQCLLEDDHYGPVAEAMKQ